MSFLGKAFVGFHVVVGSLRFEDHRNTKLTTETVLTIGRAQDTPHFKKSLLWRTKLTGGVVVRTQTSQKTDL
jgi:hypothetical protein